MLNKMYTTAEIDRKSFSDKDRSFVAWASKPVLDRDNELIQADAWDVKNFEANSVICWAHDYSLPPVGKAQWITPKQEGLAFRPAFANTDMGNELYQLYKDDILHGFSVGFIPKENGYIEGKKAGEPNRTYTDVELLEISCVTIPSCPEALVAAYDSGEIKTKGLQEAVKDTIDRADDVEPIEDAVDPLTTQDVEALIATAMEEAGKGIEELAEVKEGRRFSKATLGVMQTAYDALGSLIATPAEVITEDIDEEIETKDPDPVTLDEILEVSAGMTVEKVQSREEKALEMLALSLEADKGEFV